MTEAKQVRSEANMAAHKAKALDAEYARKGAEIVAAQAAQKRLHVDAVAARALASSLYARAESLEAQAKMNATAKAYRNGSVVGMVAGGLGYEHKAEGAVRRAAAERQAAPNNDRRLAEQRHLGAC